MNINNIVTAPKTDVILRVKTMPAKTKIKCTLKSIIAVLYAGRLNAMMFVTVITASIIVIIMLISDVFIMAPFFACRLRLKTLTANIIAVKNIYKRAKRTSEIRAFLVFIYLSSFQSCRFFA